MIVKAIRTHKITTKDTIEKILTIYTPSLEENSIVVVTSKIISICEGRIVKKELSNKEDLIAKEADYYIPVDKNKFHTTVSIKDNMLVASGGIDESNGNGYYILWPKQPQESANNIQKYLKKKFNLKNIGVIITDTRNIPLRYGAAGAAIAHSGFKAIKNYKGQPDIFGVLLKVSKVNISDSLASATVAVMGEGNEQTPIALITDIPFVEFSNESPTKEELELLHLSFEDDLFSDLLTNVKWRRKS